MSSIAIMTNSEKTNSKPSVSAEEQSDLNSSIPNLISNQVNDLFRVKAKRQDDWIFNDSEEYDDIDELADMLFESLYEHTNKINPNEGQESSQKNHQVSEETS